MSESNWAVLLGFLTVVGLRVLDYLLPKGRYWNKVDKFSKPDRPELPHKEDEQG